jgi:aspartyl-tRNA(Asn)/glutamyl-tRNA(Gln) amidotransferase subunit C
MRVLSLNSWHDSVQDAIIDDMNRDDITHLASLARIRLEDSELEQFETELPAIVEYISAVKDIIDDGDTEPNPGVRPNIFREDSVTNQPNEFSDDIIAEMPHSDGRFLSVKKILHTED